MATVTITRKEYEELTDKKLRCEYLRQIIEEDIFSPPPSRSAEEVVSALKATKKYGKKFLESLRKGLSRSSYL